MAGRSIPGVHRGRSKETKGTGPRNVDAATRAAAVAAYREHGLAEASRLTGCAKSSIDRWAKAAGVDSAAVNAATVERTAAATEVSITKRRAATAEARAKLVDLQASIALTASAAELEYLTAYRGFVGSANASELGAAGTAQTARLQAAMAGPRLSELVGSKTRAIHDLQLLDGQATEQPEGGLVVTFATPAPAVTAAPGDPARPVFHIVDLPALTDSRETA